MSEGFRQLLSLLYPHRQDVAEMWQAVVEGEHSPEDQAKIERMSPVVSAYIERRITRREYDVRREYDERMSRLG